jgi:hypothetical protein
MKNYRGAALQSVRSAMWKVFGSERLPSLKSSAKAPIIVKWKENPKIAVCHRLLFETNSENVFWISAIARAAFSEVTVPTLTSEHCAFALAVCDIFLNPKSKSITCDEKNMKIRIEKYLVYICHFLYFFYCTIF